MPAGPAGDKTGKAPAIDKQHTLLPLFQPVRQKFLQLSAENRSVALF